MSDTRAELKGAVALALALALTGFFIASFSLGLVEWDESFRKSVLVKVENLNGNLEDAVSVVENITERKAVVASNPGLLLAELPVDFTENLAEEIENALSGMALGVEVLELSPLFGGELFGLFLLGLVAGLFALGFALLLVHRRKRVAWACPLVVGLTLGESLGVACLLGMPMGLGAIVGSTMLLLYLLSLSSFVLTAPLRSDDEIRRIRESAKELSLSGCGILLIMFIAFAVLIPETVATNFFIVVLAGTALGYLNFGWVATVLFREGVPPTPVRYHVSL
jgi:hypothetical protein